MAGKDLSLASILRYSIACLDFWITPSWSLAPSSLISLQFILFLAPGFLKYRSDPIPTLLKACQCLLIHLQKSTQPPWERTHLFPIPSLYLSRSYPPSLPLPLSLSVFLAFLLSFWVISSDFLAFHSDNSTLLSFLPNAFTHAVILYFKRLLFWMKPTRPSGFSSYGIKKPFLTTPPGWVKGLGIPLWYSPNTLCKSPSLNLPYDTIFNCLCVWSAPVDYEFLNGRD